VYILEKNEYNKLCSKIVCIIFFKKIKKYVDKQYAQCYNVKAADKNRQNFSKKIKYF